MHPELDAKYVPPQALSSHTRVGRWDGRGRGAWCVCSKEDFSNRDLRRSNFTNASIKKANFTNAKLQGAYFIKVTAAGTNFTGANLSDVLFDRAVVVEANFTDAVVARTIFTLYAAPLRPWTPNPLSRRASAR